MTSTKGYAAKKATSPLEPFDFNRREPDSHDVQIEILYCGVCHSDLHIARDEWKMTIYPVVPGHEIVGRVTKVGKDVKSFKVGDLAAVGCMVGSSINHLFWMQATLTSKLMGRSWPIEAGSQPVQFLA